MYKENTVSIHMILKAFKYRMYPNIAQQELINKHFGCVRFIYNWGLEQKIQKYKQEKQSVSCNHLIKGIVLLKKEKEWLTEVNAQSLQMALRNLDNAYTRFFREKKGFPSFKKRRGKQTFQCPQRVKINFQRGSISLVKIPNIKTVFHGTFEGKVKTVTISQVPSGKYFVSILVESFEEPIEKKNITEHTTIGIDLGLKDFAILSNGEKVENPRYLRQSQKRLKALQQKHSHRSRESKKNGFKWSKRREQSRKRLAKQHEKVANQRNDFLHKLTHKLTHDNQVNAYCIENLGVSGMMKNRCLARSISDVAWSKFITLLECKCEWYGKHLLKIGRFDPSSKMCSKCGWIKKDLKLSDRVWKCGQCDSEHDRDINAAKNIKSFGLHKQNLSYNKYREGLSRINAQGVCCVSSDIELRSKLRGHN